MAHTAFHALVASPLGPILLSASRSGLCGLHFTDQRDCPQVPGVPAATAIVTQPSAGVREGHPSRSLRVGSPQSLANAVLPGLQGRHDVQQPIPALAQDEAPVPAVQWLQPQVPANVQAVCEAAGTQLQEYWQGRRQRFKLSLDPQGTPFQKKIWLALLEVPFGATLSYGQLAEKAGMTAGHGRAAGAAVGSNPISIIIPCHRILARDGTLNGYGGGLDRKMKLLRLEGLQIGV